MPVSISSIFCCEPDKPCCFRKYGECSILNDVHFPDGMCHFRKESLSGENMYDKEKDERGRTDGSLLIGVSVDPECGTTLNIFERKEDRYTFIRAVHDEEAKKLLEEIMKGNGGVSDDAVAV